MKFYSSFVNKFLFHVIPDTLWKGNLVVYISSWNSNMGDLWRGLTANVEFSISEKEQFIQDNMKNRISIKPIGFEWEKIDQGTLDLIHIRKKHRDPNCSEFFFCTMLWETTLVNCKDLSLVFV